LRGADLREADLHDVDLRGADLSGADLRGADLRRARTGLGTNAAVVQTFVAALVAALGGYTSSWLGETIRHAFQSPNPARQLGGVILGAEILLCLGAMVWRGTFFTLTRVLPPTVALLLLSTVGVMVARGTVQGSGSAIIALVVLFVVVLLAVALARAMALGVHTLSVVVVFVAWLLGASAASGRVLMILTAVATIVAGMRAAAGSETSPRLSRWAARIATLGGTSFRSADLRGARVAEARFRCADLRGARLDGLDWQAVREVAFCAFEDGSAPARKTGGSPVLRAWRHPA
jgi:uncharacterized protein YjbI with pentapeptide repeats